jgi:hypothetical protein
MHLRLVAAFCVRSRELVPTSVPNWPNLVGAAAVSKLPPSTTKTAMTDLRDAFRALRATPVVTVVAILSLALGIGANTGMFSIADALVLRPLPVRHADRLTLLTATTRSKTSDETWLTKSWTNPIWEAIRNRLHLYDGAFAYAERPFDLSQRGQVELVAGLRASGRMFEVLGVHAIAGRLFTEADDRRGGGPDGAVVVISYGFWQRRFGGARDVVGRTITLERVPFTIIGIAPPGFFGPEVGRTSPCRLARRLSSPGASACSTAGPAGFSR